MTTNIPPLPTNNQRLEYTADSSATLYDPLVGEHYHSVCGARTESQHVFINLALAQHPAECINILEIGWGTGLNGLLAYNYAEEFGKSLKYYTVELHPLSEKMAQEYVCSLAQTNEQIILGKMHKADWNCWCNIGPNFMLYKSFSDACAINPKDIPPANVVFMDAFSPEHAPNLWSEGMLSVLYNCMAPGAILSTYCAKGVVRRTLQKIGFNVIRTPGPIGGKREVLVATKGKGF